MELQSLSCRFCYFRFMKKIIFVFLFSPLIILAQPNIGAKNVDRNVIYGMYSGLALLMDVHYPLFSNGIGLVHVSGSGFNRPLSLSSKPLNHQGHVKLECEKLLKNGYTIFTINHRATPRFKFPAAIEDAQRAVRFIRYTSSKFNINPNKIGAIGGSSGGNIVLMLGLLDGKGNNRDIDPINRESAKVQAVIARAPVTTFLIKDSYNNSVYLGARGKEMEILNSSEYNIAKNASPVSHVSKDDPPVLLMHGDKDKTVPILHSKILIDSLEKYGIKNELIVIKNAGHGPSFRGGLNISNIDSLRIDWFNKNLLLK